MEKTAPYGCVLDTEAKEVELTYAGQEIPVTEMETAFYNERQKATVDLEKVLEQDGIFEVGSKGEIQNIAFGLYAAEELTAADGTCIPVDGLLEVVFCNTDGLAAFHSDIPLGKYYVKEVCTDGHYLLSDEKYPLEFAYQGQGLTVVNLHVNEGGAIENELFRGRTEGMKMDTEGAGLEGAKIGLFPADAQEFTEGNAVLVTMSDKKGAFFFENVVCGNYIVHELEAPEGYLLDGQAHHVCVTRQGAMVKIKITDKQVTGSVRLKKVDAEYPKNKLGGAVLELYQDTDGNGKFNPKKDKRIGKLTKAFTRRTGLCTAAIL